MKEEIKEILEYVLSLTYGNENAIKGIDKVLDYITNLQEENEELKIENEKLTQLWLDSQEKRRKAIKYIKENEFYLDYKTGACIKGVIPLLNILQGEDTNVKDKRHK